MKCPACGCPGAHLLLEVHCPNERCRNYDAGALDDGDDLGTMTINGDRWEDVFRFLAEAED